MIKRKSGKISKGYCIIKINRKLHALTHMDIDVWEGQMGTFSDNILYFDYT